MDFGNNNRSVDGMPAPLTKTRERKLQLLQELIRIEAEILTFPKGSLDMMDMRRLKKIQKNLKELYERGKPS